MALKRIKVNIMGDVYIPDDWRPIVARADTGELYVSHYVTTDNRLFTPVMGFRMEDENKSYHYTANLQSMMKLGIGPPSYDFIQMQE